ncbi:hypothetical protein INR49_008643 [Caranx melampygus]|nr:hypothetical protein INR49_008643 [Caranx melampygus]
MEGVFDGIGDSTSGRGCTSGVQGAKAQPGEEVAPWRGEGVGIDRKMSCSQTNYKLDEAQAIFNELRSIKKAISTGEKERQDLIQSLAKLTVHFHSSLSISDSASEVANSTGTVGDSCSLQQYCDTGCQTDIMGEYGSQDSLHLVDKVKLNWQYEEAKKK